MPNHIKNSSAENVSLTISSQVSKNSGVVALQALRGRTRSLSVCLESQEGRLVGRLVLRAGRVGRIRLRGRLGLRGFDVWKALGMILRGKEMKFIVSNTYLYVVRLI
jgi:hypothetical protein